MNFNSQSPMIQFVKSLKTRNMQDFLPFLRMLLALSYCMVKVQGCSKDIFIRATNTEFKSICKFEKTKNMKQPQVGQDPKEWTENQLDYDSGISDCSFLIKARDGQRVEIVLRFSGDWADVRDGSYWDSPLIGRFNGVVPSNASLKSSGTYIRVTFHLGPTQRSSGCCVDYRVLNAVVHQDNNQHTNEAMLHGFVTWVGAVLVTVVFVFLVVVCYKGRKTRRNNTGHVLLPEDNSSVTGETFAVEVELPSYDSLTNAAAQASGEKMSTEACVCATDDACIRQSYLIYARNTGELVQGPECHQAASVAADADSSADNAPDQRQYLVRVSLANDDIGPPPLYEGDNQDNRPPPLYEGDSEDISTLPLYEGDNQDNRPPPFYAGDNQDNSPPPLYEGDSEDISTPPLYT